LVLVLAFWALAAAGRDVVAISLWLEAGGVRNI
jgi:hypothetical protein